MQRVLLGALPLGSSAGAGRPDGTLPAGKGVPTEAAAACRGGGAV